MIDFLRTWDQSGIPCIAEQGAGNQTFMTVGATAVELNTVETNNDATDIQKAQSRSIISFRVTASQILIDLCTVHKLGRLTADHIDSYFAMKGDLKVGAEKFRTRIVKLSQYVPDATLNNNGRDMLTDSSWMDYRLSYSATPGLITRAIEIVNLHMPELFSQEERRLVTACLVNPSSRINNNEIQAATIMKAYIVLETEGVLPKTWIQGEKAMKKSTLKSVKSMRELSKSFKRIVDVETSAVKVDNISDLRKYGVVTSLVAGNIEETAVEMKNIILVPKMNRGRFDYFMMWMEKNKVAILIVMIIIAFFYDKFFRTA
jgi:hypothetical protein